MNTSIVPDETLTPPRARAPGLVDKTARKAVIAQLRNLRHGRLAVDLGDERLVFGDPKAELRAVISVYDAVFFTDLALGGSIGAGESYMRGGWDCDDLTALVRIMARNQSLLDGMEPNSWSPVAMARKALHWLHQNSPRGSRRNIAAHYDIGNALFALFLDRNMMYSSAVFATPETSLEAAQEAKNERICRKLGLGPDDHLLEIGTGWGGFALHAAARHGCRVTTTTISREQHDLARRRVHEAGLADRITVLLRDYRALEGRYDKIVSIEMIEAVGHRYYETYFGKCSELLADDGLMLLQGITIADQRYEKALRSVDFIQRYIFPGSCIPSVTALCEAVSRSGDLRPLHLEDIGLHYATTLRLWRERFLQNIDAVRALGYPESFIRMWEFYLCYCEGGFRERVISDVHLLLAKPRHREQAPLGEL